MIITAKEAAIKAASIEAERLEKTRVAAEKYVENECQSAIKEAVERGQNHCQVCPPNSVYFDNVCLILQHYGYGVSGKAGYYLNIKW